MEEICKKRREEMEKKKKDGGDGQHLESTVREEKERKNKIKRKSLKAIVKPTSIWISLSFNNGSKTYL